MEIRPTGNIHPDLGLGNRAAIQTGSSAIAVATPMPIAGAVQLPEPAPSSEQVTQALKAINNSMRELSQNLEFTIDEGSDRTIVKVVDHQTKEVIRQMPSKEALEIAKALDKVQGLLLRAKV
jgi:flagellar protein FlaG